MISFLEYQSEKGGWNLVQKLSELGISRKQFSLATLGIAKSVQHLVVGSCKVPSNRCIEISEKFLRGEATAAECSKASNASHSAANASHSDTSPANAASHGFNSAIYASSFATSAIRYATDIGNIDSLVCVVNSSRAAGNAFYYNDSCITEVSYASVFYSGSTGSINILRKHLPWELVCGCQIAGILNRAEDEEFILQVSKNQKLVSYATMILSEPSMHKNFKFFMREILKTYP